LNLQLLVDIPLAACHLDFRLNNLLLPLLKPHSRIPVSIPLARSQALISNKAFDQDMVEGGRMDHFLHRHPIHLPRILHSSAAF
jgi:hypothetical protein